MQRASFRHIKGVSYDLKIGLIDVDSHNFPNLCLMKLSAYHKAKGHTVEWWNTKERYDLVYKSRVFTDTYSKDTITVTNAEQVIFGGTGYDTKNRLPPEVEHSYPDYSIYPQFFGIAYGFLSRGCPRNCGFCIVSGKEGRKSVKVADLSEFWKWQPEIKIMDANLLACPDHENLIEQLIRSRAWVDFSQGLDIRLVNRDNVSLLNRVRIKAVHFAWDNPDEDLTGYFQRFLDLTAIKSSIGIVVAFATGLFGGEQVTVPDVLGKDQQTAVELIKEAGLEVGTIDQSYNDDVDEGKVAEQTPNGNTKKTKGTKVNLAVCY